jgi:hypothetical protein
MILVEARLRYAPKYPESPQKDRNIEKERALLQVLFCQIELGRKNVPRVVLGEVGRSGKYAFLVPESHGGKVGNPGPHGKNLQVSFAIHFYILENLGSWSD